MKEIEFDDILLQEAYENYIDFISIDSNEGTEKSNQLAIELLSRFCDCYLNSQDGDFIKIEISNEFQR